MKAKKSQQTTRESVLLLVICSNTDNYFEVFKGINTLPNTNIKFQIDQAAWEDILFTVYPQKDDETGNGIIVELKPSRKPFKGTPQEKFRTIKPDFLLIRNLVVGVNGHDYRNLLYGFMHANIPCVNSLESIYAFLERPVVYGALKKIQQKLGKENFPLIEQTFYPKYSEMNFEPQYPLVVKVGSVHAGYGKMKLDKRTQFEDFKTVMALHNDYITAEPFIEAEYDTRIQKIGDHIRVYKRTTLHDGWKGNMGSALFEDSPVTPKYKMWCDEVSKLFGGLDIFAIDGIISKKDKKEYILEVIDIVAIGFGPEHEPEDLKILRDFVLQKMVSVFAPDEVVKKEKQDLDSKKRELEVELINAKNKIAKLEFDLENTTKSLEMCENKCKNLMALYYDKRYSGLNVWVLISAFVVVTVAFLWMKYSEVI